MKKRPRALLACLLCLSLLGSATARDTITAGPFGLVLQDILTAFHAKEKPCEDGAVEAPEVCFAVDSVGAAYLAEQLSNVVDSYAPAGLSQGDWRSANGVWALSLSFSNDNYGHLEVYLAETLGTGVQGLVRLVKR